MRSHLTPWITPRSRFASAEKAAGEKLRSYLLHPPQMSVIATVTDFPLYSAWIFLPQMGLLLGLGVAPGKSLKNSGETATTNCLSLLRMLHAPRLKPAYLAVPVWVGPLLCGAGWCGAQAMATAARERRAATDFILQSGVFV